MMKHYSMNAYPKSYENDNFEPTILDLETFDELTIIECGESYTIIDSYENRMYSVAATSPEAAVKKYIDWVYGEMYIYEWDSVEGGWDRTDEKEWASSAYNLEYCKLSMELVEEH